MFIIMNAIIIFIIVITIIIITIICNVTKRIYRFSYDIAFKQSYPVYIVELMNSAVYVVLSESLKLITVGISFHSTAISVFCDLCNVNVCFFSKVIAADDGRLLF